MSMPFAPTGSSPASASRALVGSLFVASCLLSIVSWYTTQQGMALNLSPWFSFLASLGIQSALVLVAWLVGLNRSGRGFWWPSTSSRESSLSPSRTSACTRGSRHASGPR